MSKWFFKRVLSSLKDLRTIERDHIKRAYIDAMIDYQQTGLERFEETITEAKMIGVRNPAFDGDMVGYPDDDFDKDDEDDDKKKKK